MRKLVPGSRFVLICLLIFSGLSLAQQDPALLHNSILDSLQSITETTVPANGDLNPYGVVFVPSGFPTGGTIAAGDVLVSNFNANSGLEGTGTTIVSFSPTGQQTLFATSKIIGLDTALGVFSRGFVIVGNLPVTYKSGVFSAIDQGSLQVFDRKGNLVSTINSKKFLDSPWDLTINDHGATAEVFVSNVLSGTVTRLDVSISSTSVTVNSMTQIGSGFGSQIIPAIVAVGPTGLAYDSTHDTLYVASTEDNKIFGIGEPLKRTTSAGTGFVVFDDPKHLHGPLGLTFTPNGNLIAANGDGVNPGGTQNDLVEFTREGSLVATYQIDSGLLGAAFGLASTSSSGAIRFAAVDDDLNTITIWTLQ
jgi:hypothetical protein